MKSIQTTSIVGSVKVCMRSSPNTQLIFRNNFAGLHMIIRYICAISSCRKNHGLVSSHNKYIYEQSYVTEERLKPINTLSHICLSFLFEKVGELLFNRLMTFLHTSDLVSGLLTYHSWYMDQTPNMS